MRLEVVLENEEAVEAVMGDAEAVTVELGFVVEDVKVTKVVDILCVVEDVKAVRGCVVRAEGWPLKLMTPIPAVQLHELKAPSTQQYESVERPEHFCTPWPPPRLSVRQFQLQRQRAACGIKYTPSGIYTKSWAT